jgi:hypothetical protein
MGARRIRTIKPEILEDEKAAALSDRAWRLFVSTFALADDDGRFRSSPTYLAGQVFHAHGLTADQIEAALAEVVAAEMLSVYEHKGQRYGVVLNWRKHQRVDHPKPSYLPAPDDPDSRILANRREHSRHVSLDRDLGSGTGILDRDRGPFAAAPPAAQSQPPGTTVIIPSSPAVGLAVQHDLPGVLPGVATPAVKNLAEKEPCCGPAGDPAQWMKQAEHEFCLLHRERLGLPYVHEYARDRKALKKLPAAYVPRLSELVRRFFDTADDFVFTKQGVHIPAFVSRVSTLLGGRGRNGKLTARDLADMAMKHEAEERNAIEVEEVN